VRQVARPPGGRDGSSAPLFARLLSPSGRRAAGVSTASLAIALLAPALLTFLSYQATSYVHRRGWRQVLRQVFSWPGERARAAPNPVCCKCQF